MGKYDNIINNPHHVSKKHPQMSLYNRAAQFSPFAALTGYEDVVAETSRLTEEKHIVGEDALFELDNVLFELQSRLAQKPLIRITYFVPDEKKTGGRYIDALKNVKEIKADTGELIFTDNTRLLSDRIVSIELI